MKFPKIVITSEILNIISEIDEFKGHWKTLGLLMPEKLLELKKVATIESIGSSTRIEGVKLSDQEVERLLSNLGKESFSNRDEEEIAGYSEVMEVIFDSYENISFSENYVKQLHSILLKYSSKDKRHKGDYKKICNNVEAFDSEGKSLGIIFQTSSTFETPLEMNELIKWTNEKFESKEFHPLIIISFFIVYFLKIHPFQDGNGRLSRVLTTFLLLKNGYAYVPYVSMEKIIEENKDMYYLSLRRSQKELQEGDGNIENWLLFFLKTLQKQKQKLEKKVENLAIMYKLSDLSEKIINLIKEYGKLNISEIERITGANKNTIKVRLKELVSENLIKQNGKGKNTYYTFIGILKA